MKARAKKSSVAARKRKGGRPPNKKAVVSAKQWIGIGKLFSKIRYPVEFHRKPRGFEDWSRYKASELRIFTLYGSEFFISDVIRGEYLFTWRLLSCALRILSDKQICRNDYYNKLAHSMLTSYVRSSADLFADHYLSIVVHHLTHLAADCRRFGPLDYFSGFKYENMNGRLKRFCRSYKNPLVNVAHTLQYSSCYQSRARRNLPRNRKYPYVDNGKRAHERTDSEGFEILHLPYFRLKLEEPDCYFFVVGKVIPMNTIV